MLPKRETANYVSLDYHVFIRQYRNERLRGTLDEARTYIFKLVPDLVGSRSRFRRQRGHVLRMLRVKNWDKETTGQC